MKNNITVHDITDSVPTSAICERFGVKHRSIRLARERGVFPASWYRGMKQLCKTHGADFSDDLFNWKSPDGVGVHPSPTKGGDPSSVIQGPDLQKVNGAQQ